MLYVTGFLFSLLLFLNYFADGAQTDDTILAIVHTDTNTSTTGLSCPEGHIDPPNCTKCALNYENQNETCLQMRSSIKPSGSGRRILLVVLICLSTGFVALALLVVYGRSYQHRRHRAPTNIETSSGGNNRFGNLLRSFGWNRRGQTALNTNDQSNTTRTRLNENPDEALLFDDPYTDGGFGNSSANPYKSLTLRVN